MNDDATHFPVILSRKRVNISQFGGACDVPSAFHSSSGPAPATNWHTSPIIKYSHASTQEPCSSGLDFSSNICARERKSDTLQLMFILCILLCYHDSRSEICLSTKFNGKQQIFLILYLQSDKYRQEIIRNPF